VDRLQAPHQRHPDPHRLRASPQALLFAGQPARQLPGLISLVSSAPARWCHNLASATVARRHSTTMDWRQRRDGCKGSRFLPLCESDFEAVPGSSGPRLIQTVPQPATTRGQREEGWVDVSIPSSRRSSHVLSAGLMVAQLLCRASRTSHPQRHLLVLAFDLKLWRLSGCASATQRANKAETLMSRHRLSTKSPTATRL
jgi:hypothetical protein